jgi:serine/threonine protein phosphatase PrpC
LKGWAGPAWGEPSPASFEAVPLRQRAAAPDSCFRAEGGVLAGRVVLAASVAGVSHRLASRRGEDCYGWATNAAGTGRLALVVADGVGSAGRGGEGAEIAVRAALDYLASCTNWGPGECGTAVNAAKQALVEAGGASADALSTTLVVALVDERQVLLERVGDSTAWVLTGEKWRETFIGPADDSPGSAPTLALPSCSEALAERASLTLEAGEALVLVTDGVGDPLRDGPETVAPALAKVLGDGPTGSLSPLDLARAIDFSRRGCHDDRTVVAVWLVD